MKKIKNLFLFSFLATAFFACKKEEISIPPTVSEFTASTSLGTYFIQNSPNSSFKIPVGLTAASTSPTTINFTVTSPTGATAGTQYTVESTTITIPAGKVVDTITVKGLFAGYPTGRRDTLVFKITGGTVGAASWSNTYTLVMQKSCNVDLNSFLGNYTRTNEFFGSAYGPYLTSISSVTPISATKGRIVVQNLYDSGWGPIEFELDWTDPANFKATVIPKSAGIANAGTISSTYAGRQVAVRPFAGEEGTFSSCDGTLTLKMQLGVAGLGFFNDLYTVTMVR
ncbi:MAG TPA: hypothetical protein VF609_11690 [Flavisolibacter sp.]|jgi:hypothetical protein